MAEATPEQAALGAVQERPDDATFEDSMVRLSFLERVARGRADAHAGRTVPPEEVVARFGLGCARPAWPAPGSAGWWGPSPTYPTAVHDHIARDSPRYVVTATTRPAADRLRARPGSGRVVPEQNDPAVRGVVVGECRVVYEFRADGRVEVLTVFHAARRSPDLGR